GWAGRRGAVDPRDPRTARVPAVQLALGEAARRPGARVAVLTDLPPTASALASAELAGVDWTAIGRRDDNVAITAVQVDAAPFAGPAEVRAEAVVRNFGAAPRVATVEASLDGTPWMRLAVALPRRGAHRVSLGAPPAAGPLRVRLSPEGALAGGDPAGARGPSQPPPGA